jgi:hypothetical protein
LFDDEQVVAGGRDVGDQGPQTYLAGVEFVAAGAPGVVDGCGCAGRGDGVDDRAASGVALLFMCSRRWRGMTSARSERLASASSPGMTTAATSR